MMDHYTVKRSYKGIKKISRSGRAYVHLVLTSLVPARSSIVGNLVPAVNTQEGLRRMFTSLMNKHYSICIDIERYQRGFEHALDYSVAIDIYMLPSNLNISIGKTKGYNNKILVSNTSMKIVSNRDINRDHKKLTPPDVPKRRSDPCGSTRTTSQSKNTYRKAQ